MPKPTKPWTRNYNKSLDALTMPTKPTKPTAADLRSKVKSRMQFTIPCGSKYGQNLVSKIAKASKVQIATVRDDDWGFYVVMAKLNSSCHDAPVFWDNDHYKCSHPRCGRKCQPV